METNKDCFYGIDTSPWWYVALWSLLRGVTIICFPVKAIQKIEIKISIVNTLLIKGVALTLLPFL